MNRLDMNTVQSPFTVDSAVVPKQSRSVTASGFLALVRFTITTSPFVILLEATIKQSSDLYNSYNK